MNQPAASTSLAPLLVCHQLTVICSAPDRECEDTYIRVHRTLRQLSQENGFGLQVIMCAEERYRSFIREVKRRTHHADWVILAPYATNGCQETLINAANRCVRGFEETHDPRSVLLVGLPRDKPRLISTLEAFQRLARENHSRFYLSAQSA